ncbi:MAG: type II toxin-antitoxin system Phd/YefM family antitoxin [Acidobacteria bacterium]|nr:type II toxin-antitoxin system Phd/YefM family antitoxin [Acidobacteriota bacterium]
MAKKINIAALQEKAAEVLGEVKRSGEPLMVTERSRPVAVLIDFKTFVAMQKRLGELEEAELQRVIRQGRDEHQQGRTRKIKSLRELR